MKIKNINWVKVGKIVLLVLLILVILMPIALPIYYYWSDFHHLKRSEDPTDWGPFGDFFGGILDPFLSFLTLIVTVIIAINLSRIERRNHDETVHSPVKPLITINTEEFFSSNMSAIGPTVHQDFYDYNPPLAPAGPYDYLSKNFFLKICNKGLGIATEVNVSFEMDLNELKELLVIDDVKIKVTSSEIITDEDNHKYIALKIDAPHFNYQAFLFKIWNLERSGLGVIDKGEELKVMIPSQLMGAFQLFNIVRRIKNQDLHFPTFFVTFSYKNIHGKYLTSKFKVAFWHVNDYHHYSMFRIFQEQF